MSLLSFAPFHLELRFTSLAEQNVTKKTVSRELCSSLLKLAVNLRLARQQGETMARETRLALKFRAVFCPCERKGCQCEKDKRLFCRSSKGKREKKVSCNKTSNSSFIIFAKVQSV